MTGTAYLEVYNSQGQLVISIIRDHLPGESLLKYNITYNSDWGEDSSFLRGFSVVFSVITDVIQFFHLSILSFFYDIPTRHNSQITCGIHVKSITNYQRVSFMFILTIYGVISLHISLHICLFLYVNLQ